MHSRIAIVAACAVAAPALGQQAILTTAPTLPSKGQIVTRHLLTFTSYDDGPVDGEDIVLTNSVAYGLTGNLGVQFDLPYRFRDVDGLTGGDVDTSGLADADLSLKWRVWQDDFGAVDTARLAVLGGVQLPTGADRFSSDSVDPFLGAAFMYIRGRHGLGASARWLFTTGDTDGPAFQPGDSLADALELDAAYLFRIAPETYGEEFVASWYGVLEVNTVYETNGDAEAFLAPGILYEAPSFAIEANIQVPIAQSLDNRPEREFIATIGLRLLF
ncbi:MAG: hypothetical protein ACTS27_08705 [Phycisphaerales bacterium]